MDSASIVLAMWNNDLMRHKLRTSFPAYNPCLGVIKQRTNNLIAKTQVRAINCVCWINYAATLRKFSVFLPVRNLHLHIRRCFCLQKRKRGDEYAQDLHNGGGGGGKPKNLHSEFQPITTNESNSIHCNKSYSEVSLICSMASFSLLFHKCLLRS